MKFEEALVELRKGKKIREIREYGREFIISLDSGNISILSEVRYLDDPYKKLCARIVECDWEVIEESGKTFPELFEEFKEGKKIRRKSWFSSHYIKLHDTNSVDANIVDLIENDWEVIE
jgi:hypothetical protein